MGQDGRRDEDQKQRQQRGHLQCKLVLFKEEGAVEEACLLTHLTGGM